MAKARLVHRCTDCGAVHPKWAGRCPTCDAWNTLVEEVDAPEPAVAATVPLGAPTLLADVDVLASFIRESLPRGVTPI